ncbi:hypothetical protein PCANC_25357 [Puccinia coronata f. sp. avenae]|uniref:Uncharacterized protein n=1 Tax=Puccinia coronata f. sp. avenae TaxID=200324 RepID=A0A2N5TU19_9BASI|nr:hypothetical protein PCANC_25357 [Puccinia coronata f. sp. avenae]
METQPTPRANRVGDLSSNLSTDMAIPPLLDFDSPQAGHSQPQESPNPSSQHSISQDNQNQPASSLSPNSVTGPEVAQNMVPNLHQASSRQSVVSSVFLLSSSAQSLVSVPPGKSGVLTSAFQASSMQSQLNLDNKHYELEVQDWCEAKEDFQAQCEALKQDRAQDCADCLAELSEQRAERDQERQERKEIWDVQEKVRVERIKLMTLLYGEGLLPREIQQMLQMGFGS